MSRSGLGPMDEYPIHQLPQPIAWPGNSDRNFYDRAYLNAHDRSGTFFLITGIGYYPNLGVKDAFVLIRRRRPDGTDTQTAVHFGDAIDDNRLEQRVGNYRLAVDDPLRALHLTVAETEGIALDLYWEGLFDALLEQPHVMRQGTKVTLDAQRFAQVGSWRGSITVDGEHIVVDPSTWVGTRDRSWGIRPVGEPEPDPPFEGMWWLYVPMAFDDFQLVVIIQEDPDGYRTLNDCSRVWKDGRVEQLGWPRVSVDYAPGTRVPTGATISTTGAGGSEVTLTVHSLLPVPIHVGGGYGGDPDWAHGVWRGADFTERLTYDMTSAEIVGRMPFGVIDHVGRAECREADGTTRTGWGLFEHGALGRHDPSGFADWLSVAPG